MFLFRNTFASAFIFFNETENKIITDYPGVVKVSIATSEAIYECIIEFLKLVKLDVNKLIGIGTDGAANLDGKNNSDTSE